MKAVKLLAIVLGSYLGLVVAVESLVGVMGERQAERGAQPGEHWLVIRRQAAGLSRRASHRAGARTHRCGLKPSLGRSVSDWLPAKIVPALEPPVELSSKHP